MPPFPRPDYASRNSQACTGVFVVTFITGLLVALPHGVGATAPRALPIFAAWDAPTIGFMCLYIEAFLAMVCLIGILFGDPGALKRSPSSCFPLPPSISDKLRAKQSLAHLDNIYTNGQIFCVRCCIWRPESHGTRADATHHCSICQRCVVDFDHHCGVFGRCIAGKGWRGNMGYFKGILLLAILGLITSFATTFSTAGDMIASPPPPNALPTDGRG